MSYADLINVRRAGQGLTMQEGAIKGDMARSAGNTISGAINKYSDYRIGKENRQETFAHDTQMQQGRQDFAQSMDTTQWNRERGVAEQNARAMQDTLNALRGPGEVSGAASIGAQDLAGATGKPVMTGTSGPTSPSIQKLSGFSDVHAAQAAYQAMVDDQERRRVQGERASDFGAATRAFGGVQGGNPQNPLGGVAGGDLAGAARGGYMPEVSQAAAALRQGSYVDPMQEETLARTRGFEDVMRPRQIVGADMGLQQDAARTQLLQTEASKALREPLSKPAKPITAGEINQLLATSTGRQHEQLRSLQRQLEQARKGLSDPYASPETRASSQQQVDAVTQQINTIAQEIDAIHQQWFGVLGQQYPGVSFPSGQPTPQQGGGDLQSAIDAILKQRGASAQPAPSGR